MPEKLEESQRRGSEDIPPIGNIKRVTYPEQWIEDDGYPIEEEIADYYVEYEYAQEGFGSLYLIEASKSALRHKISQLETTARNFQILNKPVGTYLIVLNKLDKRSSQKYKLVDFRNHMKVIYERVGYDGTKKEPLKINGKPIFVLYRKDFEAIRK